LDCKIVSTYQKLSAMKKTLLSVAAVLGVLPMMAQTVIFSENFQSVTSPAMPAGWVVTNVDGLTPATNVNWCTNAWVTRADFTTTTNTVAVSISWYTPAGVSNDWMATPQITLPSGTGLTLRWKAKAQDPAYPDGYRVYVTTATGGAPSDFTGGSGAQLLNVSAENASWTTRQLNLDAYAGQTIRLGFQNYSNDMFVLLMDDIEVVQLSPNDAACSAITTSPYQVGPANVNITGTIVNGGSNPITAVTVKWTDGTTVRTQNLTGLNIASGASHNFTHANQLAVASGTNYNIKMWTELTGDPNAANDTAYATIYGLTFMPTKRVVGEEGTGTWCGWCPRGHVFMEQMHNNYPNTWIGIAVHNSDPMAVSAYDAAIGGLIGGYPSGVVDREVLDIDPSQFPAAYNSQITKVAPANISVTNTWNSGSRAMTVTVNANWAGSFNNTNYRLAAIVVENNVTGTTSGYNQTNYYNGGTTPLVGAGHNWQTAGNPVPAASMVYQEVGRALLGGFGGQAGSVPSSVTAGSNTSYTFNHTLPASQDENDIVIVGVLIDNTTGRILNAAQAGMVLGLEEDGVDNFDFTIFPNPANDMTTIKLNIVEAGEVNISIVSITGAVVSSTNYGTLVGENNFIIDGNQLNSGIYFVNVNVGGQVITRKVVIAH
jgi:hypothetical protein